MEKKIIFFDVDGTLVSDTGGIEHVPESAKRAIALTRAKGNLVYLCTGRSKAEIYDFILECGIDGVIGAGGGYIEIGNQMLYHKKVTNKAVNHMVDYFDTNNFDYYVESNGGLFASKNLVKRLERIIYGDYENYPQAKARYEKKDSHFINALIEGQEMRRDDINKACFLENPNIPFNNIIKEFNGQTLEISNTSKTYLNPFHMDIGYDDKEPIKSKIEWILAWCESLLGGRDLTGSEKSIIDRCVKNLFFDYERSGFSDKSLIPNLKKFWDELSSQQESEAKNLALIMERYAKGSLEMFAHETNIDIHNRLVSFDISKLPESILKTGYLVVLDHIWNRITNNRKLKKNTWIIIDEFHVLLENVYSAQFVAKLYKEGRKYNSFPTIITQNIADILENKNGRKILSNSEFAVVLKQKPLDLVEICKIFDISNEEASYITSDISGQGIIVYGNSKVPFRNNVPKDFYIYKLNDTSNNANIALQR